MVHGRKMFCDHFDYAAAISNGDQNDSTIDSNNQKGFNVEWSCGRSTIGLLTCCEGCNSVAPTEWVLRA